MSDDRVDALKEFRRREALLSELLMLPRAQRRRRRVKIERYRLELELGMVQAAIEHLQEQLTAIENDE